ncbi:MAG TPA: alpha/beta fold hydrolase [Pseudonocardia sp.]|nr:alpha/beta fold hydrolase [Pseudonocardia sp.]
MTISTITQSPSDVHERHLTLHGNRISYLEAGADSGGPTVVLVHGLASNKTTWADVLPLLGRHAHVIAPDLLGSGESDKPYCADYSVGAHAARLRDMLNALGITAAGIVGHSYGGGVAMTFAYQFPERAERLALIGSGGLGPELSIALRAASLPGAALVAHAVNNLMPGWLAGAARRTVTGLGLVPQADLEAVGRALASLSDRASRQAFTHTVRSTVTWAGQRLAATDRLYLLCGLPILLVAGRQDSCIPHQHSVAAHELLPGSRLELLDAGHFPHHEHPAEVGRMLAEFVTETEQPSARIGSRHATAC